MLFKLYGFFARYVSWPTRNKAESWTKALCARTVFSIAGPRAWKALPSDINSWRTSFRKKLKTHATLKCRPVITKRMQRIRIQKEQQVRQQVCKTQIPPYSLKQRRRSQFRMPMPWSAAQDPPQPFIPEVMPPAP